MRQCRQMRAQARRRLGRPKLFSSIAAQKLNTGTYPKRKQGGSEAPPLDVRYMSRREDTLDVRCKMHSWRYGQPCYYQMQP